jgi:hypothetical protein
VMHRVNDASSSHVLALTFGVFPGSICTLTRVRSSSLPPRGARADARVVRLAAAYSGAAVASLSEDSTGARLPGLPAPFDVPADAATARGFACAFPRAAGCTSPTSLRPRGFAPPRRLIPPLPPGLVSCRCRPWACIPFEGFSPTVAPGASRLAVSSLSFIRLRGPASRMSASVGRVDTASWG